jgi:hypothetical protein
MSSLKIYLYPNIFSREDWGLVTSSPVESINLGLITAANTDQEDYGLVTDLTTPPFGEADLLGGSELVRTYNYNESSIVGFQSPEDYGSVGLGDTITSIDDYGSIDDTSGGGQIDYGPIGIASTAFPFGTITISGEAVITPKVLNIYTGFGTIFIDGSAGQKNTESYIGLGTNNFSGERIEKSIFSYVGVGTFSSFGGAVEVFGANPAEDTRLFTFSGSALDIKNTESYFGVGTNNFSGASVEKNAESYVGLGTFSAFGGAAESFGPNPPENDVLFDISGEDIERRTYSYNELAIDNIFTEEDYGSIEDSLDVEEDYGSIENTISLEEDYGSITVTESSSPFGLFTISGSVIDLYTPAQIHVGVGTIIISGASIEKNTESYIGLGTETFVGNANESSRNIYIGSGTFSSFGGAVEVFGANPPENDVLFTISGASIEKNTESYVGVGTNNFSGIFIPKQTFSYVGVGTNNFTGTALDKFTPSYVGVGTFSSFDSLIESVTFDYNESSIVGFQSPEDYGSVGLGDTVTSIDDYGSIDDTSGGGQIDYGPIGIASTAFPFGTITISGEAETSRKILNIHIGFGTIFIDGASIEKNTESYVGLGTNNFSGERIEKSIFSYIGLGTFSSFGGAVEVFGANPAEDTRLFTFSGAALDIKNTESYVGVGTNNFSGVSIEKNTESYVGVGTFSAFGSAAESFGPNPPENDVLFDISGEDIERRTYSYNELAISDFYSEEDYGSIEDSLDVEEDYGSVESVISTEEDYGSITVNESSNPFGLFTISGSVIDLYTPSQIQIGLGTIFIDGSAVEKNTESYVGLGTETFVGNANESSRNIYIGSGTFSAISGAAEVFGANPPDRDVLFTISGASLQKNTESYVGLGTITISGISIEKNTESYVGVGTETFVGTALDKFTPSYVGVGTNNFSGISVEKNTESYVGVGTNNFSGTSVEKNTESYVGVGTITVSGASVEKNTESYVGVGTFSAFGSAAETFGPNPPENDVLFDISGEDIERRTYSYNELAIFDFYSEEDYGSIEDSLTEEEDYGSIENTISLEEDYGSITVTESSSPFGLFIISGISRNQFIPAQIHIGLGTIFIDGSAVEKNTESYVGLGTNNFSGTSVEKNTESYVGSGTFSAFGSAAEVFGANPPEDTRLFTFSGNALVQFLGQQIHIGLGTIFIDGSAIEKNTESYVGFDTSIISGSFVPKQTFSYVGVGTFSSFGGLVESATFDYNESSIKIYESPEDYGSVGLGDTVTSIDDYGFLDDSTGANQVDYGQIVGIASTAFPFGTITISGAGFESFTPTTYIASGLIEIDIESRESFTPTTYIGSGTFSAFGGGAESFGPNPPENDVLFEISGEDIERRTYSYNELAVSIPYSEEDYGSVEDSLTEEEDYGFIENSINLEEDYGSITVNESSSPFGLFTISGSAEIFNVPSISGVGTINISGESVIRFLPEFYIGSGSFSAFGGAAEVFSANPPEDTRLFTFSGAALDIKNTESYVGVGNINFSGASVEKNTESYVGLGTFSAFGGAAEVFGANPPEDVRLFTISGQANAREIYVYTYDGVGEIVIDVNSIEKNVESYVGFTSISIVGAATSISFKGERRYSGSGQIDIFGQVEESFTPSTYIGLGTFSAISGAAEVFGANPPDRDVLFTISGASVEKNTESYIGLGTFSVFGESESKFISNYIGETDIEIDIESKESFTPSTYIGLGTFSAFGGAAETFGPNPPENDVLFTISGASVEKNTESYVGFTSISISGDASIRFIGESKHIGVGTIFVSGLGKESYIPKYVGIASILIDIESKESFTPATYIGLGTFSAFGSAAEVFGANPPEDTRLFTFSGSALDVKNTESYVGVGTFSAFGGSAESFGPNPPENDVLFTFSGTATEKNVERYVGFGAITISGNVVEVFIANPPEDTRLFIFSGSANTTFFTDFTFVGFGTISILGDVEQKYISNNVGLGTFSAISGAAEVYGANPPENDVLFTIFGTARESFTPATYIGFASAIFSGIATDRGNPFVPGIVFVQII